MEYQDFLKKYNFKSNSPWLVSDIMNKEMIEEIPKDIPQNFMLLRDSKVESSVYISSDMMKIMFLNYSEHYRSMCRISLRPISSVYSYLTHLKIFCEPVDILYDHYYNDFVYLRDILHRDRWKDGAGLGRRTMREFCGPSEDHWLYPFLEPFMDLTFEEIRMEDDMNRLIAGG